MFTNLTLRTKLVAIAVPPLVVLAIIAAYSVLLSRSGANDIDQVAGDIRTLGVTALAAFLLSALTVIVIGRSITDPLDELIDAADDLATVRLPMLTESLRNPAKEAPEFDPISVDNNNDELGKLVMALNAVQDSARDVAVEQRKLVRQGVSDLVINLARRNQSLLDRQIEFIDKLEASEEDPDRLEELFGLDHLATRMRRNAESLLVLAGAEPSRRRGGPVAVADILRVAMSEIEDYRHVHLVKIDDGQIGAQPAVDLAHLLSEIMENATQFSPPDSPVEVNGMAQDDGCYLISVTDHGLGMPQDQLEHSNVTLSNPTELGLGLSRSLGFIVIGRLAKRLDVTVELTYTEGGGITALILVPAAILTGAIVAPGAPASAVGAMPPAAASALAAAPSLAQENDEPSWLPPTMPDRGANPIGERVATENPAPVAQSEALAKLLGQPVVAPTIDPFASPTEPATPSFDTPSFDTAALDMLSFESAYDAPTAQSDSAPLMQRPIPEPGLDHGSAIDPFAPPPGAANPFTGTPSQNPTLDWQNPTAPEPSFDQTSHLEQAMPTGDDFDAGIDSLLQPPAVTAQPSASGLVKRDRSKSMAPVSEGRPVTASVRSPDEIREMLARYRDGRGRPTAGSETRSESGEQA